MSKLRPNLQALSGSINRRSWLRCATGLAAGAATFAVPDHASGAEQPAAQKRRLKQSLVQWCYEKYWNIEQMSRMAKQLGCYSVELVDPKDWPTLRQYGLICALAPSHGFEQGMNNPKYQAMCLEKLRHAIDACAEYGFPNVITFTGFREDISDEAGIKNCVAGYGKVIGHAEKKKVNLCLEMLNSRVREHMKGHPGYQGDHTDYCMRIIKAIGSSRMKLLFDVYHVQIMDGDVIQRIHQHADYIGHIHTAGNPGRGELDDQQEINYPPIMRALVKIGYKGYVGQEFIPTRDPSQGLREAVALCDV